MDRNSTNFPSQLLARLQGVYDEYTKLRAADAPLSDETDQERDRRRLAGILKYYQFLVHWYMTAVAGDASSPDPPRGLLVYHKMGMGKTFEAVAVALSAIGVVPSLPADVVHPAFRPRRVIVVASKTLHGNFDSNLEKFISAFASESGDEMLTRARAMISYVTMDAHNMAEQVVRATRVAQIDKALAAQSGRTGSREGQGANALDGMLLVVDEAHNFFRAIINSAAATTNARRLYTMIMAARDLKIMFLTGTPSSKHPFELVPCFNMLAGVDLLPTQYDNFSKHFVDGRKIKNRGRLANRLFGLVSYAGYDLPTTLHDDPTTGGSDDAWWKPTFALRTPQLDDQGIPPTEFFVDAGFLPRPDMMHPLEKKPARRSQRYVGLAWSENSGEFHCKKQIGEYYALHAELKNSFEAGGQSVTNKAHLPSILAKLDQQYREVIPKTWDLKYLLDDPKGRAILEECFKSRPLILKESESAEQLGVELVGPPVTPAKLRATKTFSQGKFAEGSHVVSELVPDPLLWNVEGQGRKFHLRVYIMLHLNAGRAYAHLHEEFVWVITAAQPYVEGEWENRDIHLSGASRSVRDPDSPMLFRWLAHGAEHVGWSQDQVDKSWEALKKMAEPVAAALANSWKPFAESGGGYKYYGIDAMLSADGRAWILEVNNRPAWGNSEYIYPWMAEEVVRWGLRAAGSPHFGLGAPSTPFWEGAARLMSGPLSDIPDGLALAPIDDRSDDSTRAWNILSAGAVVGEVLVGRNGRISYEFDDTTADIAAGGVSLAIEAYVAVSRTSPHDTHRVTLRADQDPYKLHLQLNFKPSRGAKVGLWERAGRERDEHQGAHHSSEFDVRPRDQPTNMPLSQPLWNLYTKPEREKLEAILASNAGRAFAPSDLLVDLASGQGPTFGLPPPYRSRKAPDLEYRSRNEHQGQRKLFLTELYLLSTRLAGPQTSDPIVLLYAGAACGLHLTYLAELFPQVEFHLYDPAPFSPGVMKHPRLHTYREFFTDEVAQKWSESGELARRHGHPHFYLSDIRLGSSDFVKMEKQIVGDMEAQRVWVEIIRPSRASMLKFRPEYRQVTADGEEFKGHVELKYFSGEVLFQCWPPTFSTERRLIVDCRGKPADELPYVDYDIAAYDALSSAHNLLVRPWVRYHDLDLSVASKRLQANKSIGLGWDMRAEAAIWELYIASRVQPAATVADYMVDLSERLLRWPNAAGAQAIPRLHASTLSVAARVVRSSDETLTVALRIPQTINDTDLDIPGLFVDAGFQEDSRGLNVPVRETDRCFTSLAWSEPSSAAEFIRKQIKQFCRHPAELKNYLDDGKREATVKLNMYRNLRLSDPGFLRYTPETWDLAELAGDKLDKNVPVFLKASVGFGQSDVITVGPPVTYEKLVSRAQGLPGRKKTGAIVSEEYVVSRTIPDPLLWHFNDGTPGRKFHIRVYAIASVEGGRGYVQVNKQLAWVLTAAKPYERKEHAGRSDSEYWEDLDIHLTGASRTPCSLEWFAEGGEHVRWSPEQMAQAWASVEQVAGDVTKIIAQNAAPFEETHSGFEIFGLDIMFSRDGQAWLIEINNNPSWSRESVLTPRVITEMIRWSIETTIRPHFGLGPRPLPIWEGPAAAGGPLKNMPPGMSLHPVSENTWDVVQVAETLGQIRFDRPQSALTYSVAAGSEPSKMLYGLALGLETLAARHAPQNPEIILTSDPLKLGPGLGFRPRTIKHSGKKITQQVRKLRKGGRPGAKPTNARVVGGSSSTGSLTCVVRAPQTLAQTSYVPVEAFTKRGFIPVALETAKFVHVAWTESSSPGRWSKQQKKLFEELPAEIKSTLGLQKRAATDKGLLYQNLKRLDPSGTYLPRTWLLDELLDSGKVGSSARKELGTGPIIVKERNSFGQRGVSVHPSFDMRKLANLGQKGSPEEIIVSDLVQDPLLWDGKKFHLRIYLLVVVDGGASYTYVLQDRVEVYTARRPYKDLFSGPADPDIHMSGGSRTEQEFLWFRDAPHHTEWDSARVTESWALVLEALRGVGLVIGSVARPYEESFAGFEVFGVDLMFDRAGKAWLIEVNDRLGWLALGSGEGGGKISPALVESIVEWELNAAILPHFGMLARPTPLQTTTETSRMPAVVGAAAMPAKASGQPPFWSVAGVGLPSLKPLAQLSQEEIKILGMHGSQPEIYEHLGPGHPWDSKRFEDLRVQAKTDEHELVRQYYHWAIIDSLQTVVGYVSLRPRTRSTELQLRYFIASEHQGKGLGRAGVKLALAAWAAISAPSNPRVWIHVLAAAGGEPANQASAKLAIALGFEREPGLIKMRASSLVAYSRLARVPVAIASKTITAGAAKEKFSFPDLLPTRIEEVEMSERQYLQYLMAREKESAEGGGAGGSRGAPGQGSRPPPPLSLPGGGESGSTYNVMSRMAGNYAPPRKYMPTNSVLDPDSITQVNVADLPDDAFTAESSPKFALMMKNIASGPGQRFLIYSQFKGIGGLAVAARFLELEGFERFILPTTGGAPASGGPITGGAPTTALWERVFGDYSDDERALVANTLKMQDTLLPGKMEFTPADLLLNPKESPDMALPYRHGRDSQAFAYTNLHRGQRKLFLTELYLLSTELAKTPGGHDEPCVIVYAGAATGHHLPLLSELFPKAVFHLYDPAPFAEQVRRETRVFHVYNDYFTDDTARSWSATGENTKKHGRPAFFICDIRLDAQSGRKDFEVAVKKDMESQSRWTTLMQPTRSAMLKFRLPYLDPTTVKDGFYGEQGGTLNYLAGKILWQCWPPRMSGETRLIVDTSKVVPTSQYPLRLYESRTYTHNIIKRPWVRYRDRDLDGVEGYDGSWDSRAEAETWALYLAIKSPHPPSKIADAPIAKHMNRLTRTLNQGLIQKKHGPKVTGTLHGLFPNLVGSEYAEALAQRVRELTVAPRRVRHMTHQMKNTPSVHEEFLQAAVYFPMSREWLRHIDKVAGSPQPFVPARDLRVDCDFNRPVPLPVPKKVPLQAVGLALPRRTTVVALIYFMADKLPTTPLGGGSTINTRTATLTGPISAIAKSLPKLLAQLFPMVALRDEQQTVFRLQQSSKSWDLTYHADSTVCDRCHSGETASLWGCWSPHAAPAAHYHICEVRDGGPPKPTKPCEITEHSLSIAAAHLIYDRCWTRYQVPRSKLFGDQMLETVPGYDGCWDCTAEAHTWLHYMRFRHQILGITETYKASDYMRVLGDALGEPLNPSHSGHGRFVSSRARAAVLAAGYTIASSRREDKRLASQKVGGAVAPPSNDVPPRVPRYVIISGDVSGPDRTRIQKIWQSPENRFGEIIRGILVTKAGALGLDLSGRQVHKTEPYWDKALEEQINARFRRINALDYLPLEERTVQPYLYLAVGNSTVLEGLPPDALEVPAVLAGELPRGTTVDVAFHERALQILELNDDFRGLLQEISIERALYRDPAEARICRPTGTPLFHTTVEEDLRLPDACDPIRSSEIRAKKVTITLDDGESADFHYVEDSTSALGYRFYRPDTTLGWSKGETFAEVDPATSLYLDLLRAIGQLG
jgi:RimJ/RimL family protein N-acetyltransferase